MRIKPMTSLQHTLDHLQHHHDTITNRHTSGNGDVTQLIASLTPHSEHLLDAFKQWARPVEAMIEAVEFQGNRPDPLITTAVATILRSSSSQNLPSWFEAYLPITVLVPRGVDVDMVLALFEGVPEEIVARAIEVNISHFFYHDIGLHLLKNIHSEEAFQALIETTLARVSASDSAHILAALDERVITTLKKVWAATPENTNVTKTLLMVATLQHSVAIPEVYLHTLGHKTKAMRELAQSGISQLGPNAQPMLEEGVKARKKAVREFCATQLELIRTGVLNAPSVSPLEQLSELEQKAMRDRVLEIMELKLTDKKIASWLKKEVAPEPMTWLLATLAIFDENHARESTWKLLHLLVTHTATKEHHEEMWSAYLSCLAHSQISDNYKQWHIKKHFQNIPAAFEQRVLDHALLAAAGPMTVPMLEHYFARRYCTPRQLIAALTHSSKKVRDAAMGAARYWPPGEDAAAVVALLDERKKVTRQVAAKALSSIPSECVSPHLDTLQTAAKNEQDEITRDALDALCARLLKTA